MVRDRADAVRNWLRRVCVRMGRLELQCSRLQIDVQGPSSGTRAVGRQAVRLLLTWRSRGKMPRVRSKRKKETHGEFTRGFPGGETTISRWR